MNKDESNHSSAINKPCYPNQAFLTNSDFKAIDPNSSILQSISKDKFKDGGDEDGFIFSTDRDIEREKLIEDMKSVTAEKITMRIDEIVETEEEVNVDDIQT